MKRRPGQQASVKRSGSARRAANLDWPSWAAAKRGEAWLAASWQQRIRPVGFKTLACTHESSECGRQAFNTHLDCAGVPSVRGVNAAAPGERRTKSARHRDWSGRSKRK